MLLISGFIIYKWIYDSEISLKHTQMFPPCHVVFYDGSGWSYDESKAIHELERDRDIIILQGDKGKAMVVAQTTNKS